MKSIYKIFVLLLIVLSFNGCVSRFFSVGEERSYCDENGCNYKDSGVCASPLEVLENKDDLSELKKRNEESKNASQSIF